MMGWDGMGWDGMERDGNVAIIKRQMERVHAPSQQDETGWNRMETAPFFLAPTLHLQKFGNKDKLQGLAVS